MNQNRLFWELVNTSKLIYWQLSNLDNCNDYGALAFIVLEWGREDWKPYAYIRHSENIYKEYQNPNESTESYVVRNKNRLNDIFISRGYKIIPEELNVLI